MALLKSLSLKWKLSLALIFSGLTLVSGFAYLAIVTFESDKISYVYDSQNARLESVRTELQGKFKQALASARNVVSHADLAAGLLSPAGQRAFDEEKLLQAVEVFDEQKSQVIFQAVKPGVAALPSAAAGSSNISPGEIAIQTVNEKSYILTVRYTQADQSLVRLRVMYDMTELLPTGSVSQSIALTRDGTVLALSDLRGIPREAFAQIANSSAGDQRTRKFRFNVDDFLVSEIAIGVAGLNLIAITPEAEALGALQTLFRRALIFLVLSGFALIAISLLAARGLTRNLYSLIRAAGEIGAGNFDAAPDIPARDEVGILAGAFKQMSGEIQRLLAETKQKARMEEELKTARLVQDRLMPNPPVAQFGELEVSGVVITSTETGGDWWYYFKRGNDLYVAIADATGHGTPAALITAAARSIFSNIEKENLSLIEMMKVWDYAISSCSRREVFMTALLFRINIVSGEGVFVNAAHESPFILRQKGDGQVKPDFLPMEVAKRLGDDAGPELREIAFSLGENDSLVLFTDGMFSVDGGKGHLSELRFAKNLAARAKHLESAADVTQAVVSVLDEHRQGRAIPDDVSIVTVRRRAAGARAVSA